jgi:beta-lactam-binding protein with PASTA domain/tRNA A-37 threonylcarbamoyl transferase component Bud32
MSLTGRLFTNRYEIQREIAQGGMAEVYLARDRMLERNVALKALFPEYAREPSFVERFRREAQAAANLNHPNIVSIYDWGQETGTYFIVMELVEGQSVRDLLRSQGAIDPQRAADIGAEIASALAYAHRQGVVHRDVKPGNVLLTPLGDVKVTDFGIARAGAGDGLTQTGSVMGTATYFSPEQAQGLAVDGRSDVYSLGVVLYEMVTGVAPFTGDSPVAVAYKHVRERPVPPSQRNTSVPPELETIILTAMAKNPADRYQSAEDMRADLVRFRRGRPLAATPVTAVLDEADDLAATAVTPAAQRTAVGTPVAYDEPARRTPWIGAVAAMLVLAALVGLVLLLTQLNSRTGSIEVPNVVGRQFEDAKQILEDRKLTVVPVNAPKPANAEAGEVLDQKPRAGSKLNEGDEVTLTVAQLPQIQVPTVVGLNYVQAIARLKSVKLEAEVLPPVESDFPEGQVLESDPSAGDTVSQGTTVKLTISKGPPKKTIPNVAGQPASTAQQTLQNEGFEVDTAREPSETVAEGRVTRTDPPAGAQLAQGETVTMYVSTGSANVEIPNVVGLGRDEAQNVLLNRGFNVRVTFQSVVNPTQDGIVQDQNPDAFQKVPPGTEVTIVVGQFLGGGTTTTKPAATTTAP